MEGDFEAFCIVFVVKNVALFENFLTKNYRQTHEMEYMLFAYVTSIFSTKKLYNI